MKELSTETLYNALDKIKELEKEIRRLKKCEAVYFHLLEIIGELREENEQLKKNAIVWHKVICFDAPDENGYITASNPAEEGKEYLVLLKNKSIAISRLDYNDVGYIFEDFDWEDIEAWAELPEAEE